MLKEPQLHVRRRLGSDTWSSRDPSVQKVRLMVSEPPWGTLSVFQSSEGSPGIRVRRAQAHGWQKHGRCHTIRPLCTHLFFGPGWAALRKECYRLSGSLRKTQNEGIRNMRDEQKLWLHPLSSWPVSPPLELTSHTNLPLRAKKRKAFNTKNRCHWPSAANLSHKTARPADFQAQLSCIL